MPLTEKTAQTNTVSYFDQLRHLLFAPVDIASLVYFRIVFGALMLWEVWRYFENDWIKRYWIEPKFHFTYYGFEWIQPWSGDGMYLHMLALGALSVCIIIGLWYRFATILFFLGFTYIFLLEQARYLNHFYLICLLSFLMIFIPANRAFSMDAGQNPKIRSDTAPAWTLWILSAQIGIVYFYGGIAKLNGDWLRGEPMRMWMSKRADLPLIGQFVEQEWLVYMFSYGGLLLDLLIVPLLLWRKTRIAAFVVAVLFHLTNAFMFKIGIFPFLAIGATMLFFPPDWSRRVAGKVFGNEKRKPKKIKENLPEIAQENIFQPRRKVIIALLAAYFALQIFVPLRHFLYPGDVSWTEEGHRFSWHMKLRTKSVRIIFYVTDPQTNETWEIDPLQHLTVWQAKEMSSRPDMILQFSHYLAEESRRKGYEQVEVRVRALAALNGRKPQLLIDPDVDLSKQPRSLLPSTWINPLVEPLASQDQEMTDQDM